MNRVQVKIFPAIVAVLIFGITFFIDNSASQAQQTPPCDADKTVRTKNTLGRQYRFEKGANAKWIVEEGGCDLVKDSRHEVADDIVIGLDTEQGDENFRVSGDVNRNDEISVQDFELLLKNWDDKSFSEALIENRNTFKITLQAGENWISWPHEESISRAKIEAACGPITISGNAQNLAPGGIYKVVVNQQCAIEKDGTPWRFDEINIPAKKWMDVPAPYYKLDLNDISGACLVKRDEVEMSKLTDSIAQYEHNALAIKQLIDKTTKLSKALEKTVATKQGSFAVYKKLADYFKKFGQQHKSIADYYEKMVFQLVNEINDLKVELDSLANETYLHNEELKLLQDKIANEKNTLGRLRNAEFKFQQYGANESFKDAKKLEPGFAYRAWSNEQCTLQYAYAKETNLKIQRATGKDSQHPAYSAVADLDRNKKIDKDDVSLFIQNKTNTQFFKSRFMQHLK